MLSFAHFTCHMPHATHKNTSLSLPPTESLPDAEVCSGLGGRKTAPHTVSFWRLHNSQLQLFFLVLSLSPSLFSLLAAATHKNRSCQFKKPKTSVPASIFHTPANLSPPLSTQFPRENFGAKKKKKLNKNKANKTSVTWRAAKSNEVQILCKY